METIQSTIDRIRVIRTPIFISFPALYPHTGQSTAVGFIVDEDYEIYTPIHSHINDGGVVDHAEKGDFVSNMLHLKK